MSVVLATKTVEMIDTLIKADQGIEFRRWLGRVIGHVGDAYSTEKAAFRSHMGASLIGRECARDIWYSFHWAMKPQHEGRMLRLFNRGHLEEARFIAMLLMCGIQIFQQDEKGKQFRIHHAEGHFGGSGDGVALGIPDLPGDQFCLTEFKTHNNKSFVELKAKGVRNAKFVHYCQMQVYMRKMGIAVCLYLSVNKDTDELYGELVYLDTIMADELLDRANNLVWSSKPPAKLASTPGFWKCRYCDFKELCFYNGSPDKNCRTCEFSSTLPDTQWGCDVGSVRVMLSKETQLTGCENWKRKKDF